uniref:Uncharacterized protein n=1 Tax=Oryza meridionalis TaxID=40149 RepID=A0A0E0CEL0_9ORYZ
MDAAPASSRRREWGEWRGTAAPPDVPLELRLLDQILLHLFFLASVAVLLLLLLVRATLPAALALLAERLQRRLAMERRQRRSSADRLQWRLAVERRQWHSPAAVACRLRNAGFRGPTPSFPLRNLHELASINPKVSTAGETASSLRSPPLAPSASSGASLTCSTAAAFSTPPSPLRRYLGGFGVRCAIAAATRMRTAALPPPARRRPPDLLLSPPPAASSP